MEQGRFEAFQQRVGDFLKVDAKQLPFCWEVMFDIVEGEGNYECDFEHIRLTSDFLMSAVLLSVFHDKRVVLLEPTSYYSYQAIRIFRRWNLEAPNLEISTVGAVNLNKADVIFHHGKRFDCGNTGARTIVQVFLNEEVPQDDRSLSTLIRIANNY
jgi:hypothetical protein